MTLATDTATTFDHELGADGSVRLETVDTEIRLRGVQGTSVHVRLARGDLASEFRIDAAAGRLDLRPIRRWTWGRRRDIGPLEIDVPATARVWAGSASGSILALDLSSSVEAHSASGHVDLAGVAGTVRAETVSGMVRVRAADVTGVALKTVSGAVDVLVGRARSLVASSISGALHASGGFTGSGPFTLETVSGGVTIVADAPVQLRASTVSGEVAGTDDRGWAPGPRRTLAMDGAGPLIDVRTVSGRIRVERPSPAAESAAPGGAAPGGAAPGGAAPAADRPPAAGGAAASPDGSESGGAAGPTPEDPRLPILRALQRGEIDVAEAERRLRALEASDA